MFRSTMCPSSGENLLYLCDTGICHSVWVASGLLVGLKHFQSNQQTRRHTCRVTNISVAICLLMMGTWMPETCIEEK